MKITIQTPAIQWFKQEMGAKEGDSVRFFVRMGGCSTVQSGFSLGVCMEKPHTVGVSTIVDGITFFIEQEDLWYFDHTDLIVDYNADTHEIQYTYESNTH